MTITAHVRHEQDFYPTPAGHVAAALDLLPDISPTWVLDPGAGAGVWGIEAARRWPLATITGVELRDAPPEPCYDLWIGGDFLTQPLVDSYDLIVGNPPYKLAEEFIRRSLDLLWDGGYLVFLLRLAFLEGQARHAGLWREYPPQIVGVYGNRPSFTGNGKTDATAYAAIVWQKGYSGPIELRFISGKAS